MGEVAGDGDDAENDVVSVFVVGKEEGEGFDHGGVEEFGVEGI